MTTVAAAWVHSTEVDASFAHSMLDVVAAEMLGQRRLIQRIPLRAGSSGIVRARNEAAAAFLTTDAEWLWWVDTDMGFAADSLDRLLAAADPTDRPFVGGLCFAQMEREPDGMNGFRSDVIPAVYQWHETSDGRSGFVSWANYPRDTLAEVAGTGSAFVLVHRTVFEQVADKFGHGSWYTPMTNPSTGQQLGEDLSFCARVRMVGLPIHVHTGILTTHRKPRWIGESDYEHPEGAQHGSDNIR